MNKSPGLIWISQSLTLVARFPTRAQVAGKRVELKRRGGEEAGVGKILTPMLDWRKIRI